MKDIDILRNLCDTNGMTEYDERNFVISYLSSLGYSANTDVTGNVTATTPGESEYTVMLDAHLDKIGFVVTAITDNGFLKCAVQSGVDLRVISSAEVIVYGKEPIFGVISCIPPHLSKGEDKPIEKDAIFVDIGLDKKTAEEKVTPGDFVCFKSELKELVNNRVTAAALDDRAGVLCLLKIAQKLASQDSIPVTVKLLFSNFEEVGCRGAITAAFSAMLEEAISVDVSFARDRYIKSEEGGALGDGAMIGISPVLNRRITKRLFETAKSKDIKHQTEAMAEGTGTNADKISLSQNGIPTGLVSIPLRNMHTAGEIVSLDDIEAVSNLLFSYVMNGGLFNA